MSLSSSEYDDLCKACEYLDEFKHDETKTKWLENLTYVDNLTLTVLDFQMPAALAEQGRLHFREKYGRVNVSKLKELFSKHPDTKKGNVALAKLDFGQFGRDLARHSPEMRPTQWSFVTSEWHGDMRKVWRCTGRTIRRW